MADVVLARSVIERWAREPQRMVRELFNVTPEYWQDNILSIFPATPRIALKACKGPGKTCLLSWLTLNFLLTRPHPNIVITSISRENLRDGMWKELSKWGLSNRVFQELFDFGNTRISAKAHPATWWVSARAWSKSADSTAQADTLSGIHAQYAMFVLDEAGGIPDAVMAAAEGVMTSAGSNGGEAHLLIAGNPTHLSGPLYRATTSERKLWHLVEISGDPDDPRRASRVPIEWARNQIEKYGRDNPWVLVNVFGRFPPASVNALLGVDEVAAAMGRHVRAEDLVGHARVLGVDVARYGDDSSIIFPRQGQQAFTPAQYRNLNSIEGAGVVARKITDWEADAAFIDDTGGFGSGWIDQLARLKFTPIGIHFASSALDHTRFANRRAEMILSTAEWVKGGGCLPSIPELRQALTVTTYTFDRSGRMIIEPKDDVKIKLGFSPDHLDGLALTFAQPVACRVPNLEDRRIIAARSRKHQKLIADYDPFPLTGVEKYRPADERYD